MCAGDPAGADELQAVAVSVPPQPRHQPRLGRGQLRGLHPAASLALTVLAGNQLE